MFSHSVHEVPGSVAYVLCSTARRCAYDEVYDIRCFTVALDSVGLLDIFV